MTYFIPIDKKTIRYDPAFPGPYVIPCKKIYEQTNSIRTIGDKIEGGIVVGESKMHYIGNITESKEYREVYKSSPYPEFRYKYEDRLVQCQNIGCWKTAWISDCPLHKFYDSFHNDHYDDGLSRSCPWCEELLDLEFQKLDRPTLEQYAAQNKGSV